MLYEWVPDENLVIGECLIRVCDGNTCHSRRSKKIRDKFWELFGLSEEQQTTSDNKFTVVSVPCTGDCAYGPVVHIGDEMIGNVTVAMVPDIVAELKKKYNAE